MPTEGKQQYKCSNCDGRAWQDDVGIQSQCRKCGADGVPVPDGQEIRLSQFKCDNCDEHAWYDRAEQSKCHSCEEYGVQVPEGQEIESRQFKCDDCKRRWIDAAKRSKCRECGKYGKLVPRGEEVGVFACKFRCTCNQCDNCYTVICEMTDTAECYKCRDESHSHGHGSSSYSNSPYGFYPRRRINKKTDNVHSCSKCDGRGDCPNLRQRYGGGAESEV